MPWQPHPRRRCAAFRLRQRCKRPTRCGLSLIEGHLEPVLRQEGVPDSQSLPRQQLPPVYWQNGYVDVIRPRAVLEKNSMWGDKAIPFVVNEPLFELDYPENIPAIELALERMKAGQQPFAEQTPSDRHPV